MLERLYIALWGIYFMAVGLFFASGMLTAKVAVVFGFIFFGMTFLGMIGVLPFYVTHHDAHPKH